MSLRAASKLTVSHYPYLENTGQGITYPTTQDPLSGRTSFGALGRLNGKTLSTFPSLFQGHSLSALPRHIIHKAFGNPVVAVLGQALRNETASIITVIIHIMADNKNNLSQVIDVSYTATF